MGDNPHVELISIAFLHLQILMFLVNIIYL